MEMTTLLTPNLVLTAALPVLSDRRISVKKTLLQWLNSFWLRKLSWRTQLSFPLLSVGKVQSWIAKAEAERFPESLTRLPPFPQPPPPWLEQGWHGRWDSNAGVGGPTKLDGPPPHHEIPSTGPPRPTMATTLFFSRRKYFLPHLEDGSVSFRSKYLSLLGCTQPTNHTASLGSNWFYNDWDRLVSFFRVKKENLI